MINLRYFNTPRIKLVVGRTAKKTHITTKLLISLSLPSKSELRYVNYRTWLSVRGYPIIVIKQFWCGLRIGGFLVDSCLANGKWRHCSRDWWRHAMTHVYSAGEDVLVLTRSAVTPKTYKPGTAHFTCFINISKGYVSYIDAACPDIMFVSHLTMTAVYIIDLAITTRVQRATSNRWNSQNFNEIRINVVPNYLNTISSCEAVKDAPTSALLDDTTSVSIKGRRRRRRRTNSKQQVKDYKLGLSFHMSTLFSFSPTLTQG